MYCSAIFTVYFLTPSRRTADEIRSDGERNPIGRRTVSDWTADGIQQGVQLSQLHQQSRQAHSLGWCTSYSVGALIVRLVHLLLGWCTSYSVGALETSAPPKRHQHLCRSVKSVGLILSKSEFRGSSWQGVQLSQLHQQSRQAHSLGWCTSYSVGALIVRLVHLRQVHPLRGTNICVDL